MSFLEYFLPVISYLGLPLSARLSYFLYAPELPVHLIKMWNLILFIWIKTFLANASILYPLETPGDLWLSDILGVWVKKYFIDK